MNTFPSHLSVLENLIDNEYTQISVLVVKPAQYFSRIMLHRLFFLLREKKDQLATINNEFCRGL